jgi:hypothetical protein
MAARWPVADLCTEVLAELDATEQLLRPATPDDASPRAFRTLVLGHVEPLRTSVSRLARDADSQSPQTSSGLPASIQREAISILDSCERTLAAIRHETVEDTLNSTIISPASRESAALQQLRSFNDRLKIVLDLRSLYVLHPNRPDSNAHVTSAHLQIYWAPTEMLGLRVSPWHPPHPRLICW